MYVFISKDYDFTNENSIDDILNALFGYNSSQVDAVYSDILINIKGRQTPLKSQRTASKNLLLSNEILNIPFAVKQHALPKFKDQFKHLFLHMGILECFQNCLIIHCPKFCFSVNNISPSNAELIKEMEMLKDGKQ